MSFSSPQEWMLQWGAGGAGRGLLTAVFVHEKIVTDVFGT